MAKATTTCTGSAVSKSADSAKGRPEAQASGQTRRMGLLFSINLPLDAASKASMNRMIRTSMLLVLMSCNGSDGGAGGGKCDLPLSQPISAPCCEEQGVDACGANLFCAAFDGRSQATCYPERSRRDGESCGENRHCTSGECNIELAACKATPTSECTTELGCAKAHTGDVMVCAPFAGSLRCQPTNGEIDDPCAADSD